MYPKLISNVQYQTLDHPQGSFYIPGIVQLNSAINSQLHFPVIHPTEPVIYIKDSSSAAPVLTLGKGVRVTNSQLGPDIMAIGSRSILEQVIWPTALSTYPSFSQTFQGLTLGTDTRLYNITVLTHHAELRTLPPGLRVKNVHIGEGVDLAGVSVELFSRCLTASLLVIEDGAQLAKIDLAALTTLINQRNHMKAPDTYYILIDREGGLNLLAYMTFSHTTTQLVAPVSTQYLPIPDSPAALKFYDDEGAVDMGQRARLLIENHYSAGR